MALLELERILGRKGLVLVGCLLTLLFAAFTVPAEVFATLATAVPALFLAFVGAHSAQVVMAKKAPPKQEPAE